MKKTFILFISLLALLLMGARFSSDKASYETEGQRHWYVTSSGTGNCYSWSSPCAFRDAVAKCSSSYQDVIHLAPGDHDADNGADANGTEISVDNVSVVAFGDHRSSNTRIINSAASVDYVLQVTGDGFSIENVRFNNSDQTDTTVTQLYATGDQGLIKNCRFQQSAGASGTGVSLSSVDGWKLIDNGFNGLETYGLSVSASQGVSVDKACFNSCDVAIKITGATATRINIANANIRFSDTRGLDIDATTTTDILVSDSLFVHNADNVSDDGDWGTVHYINITFAHEDPAVYPANAGQQIQTGDGAWTWTAAATQILPVSTITEPFFITGINVQDYNAVQTFKINLFYGQAAADTSIGIYEFTVDAANPASFVPVNVGIAKLFIPANSIVGAKLESSTDGVDDITITFSYQEF